jgi:hypothetical protein
MSNCLLHYTKQSEINRTTSEFNVKSNYMFHYTGNKELHRSSTLDRAGLTSKAKATLS